jgi:hypothetical protein
MFTSVCRGNEWFNSLKHGTREDEAELLPSPAAPAPHVNVSNGSHETGQALNVPKIGSPNGQEEETCESYDR